MRVWCYYLDATDLSVKEVVAKLSCDAPYHFFRISQKILAFRWPAGGRLRGG